MKPQAMNIIKMISKPLSQRMPFQGVEMTKFVQKLPFFKRFFPYQSQKFISLCLSSFLVQFCQGENIYEKENKPDLIYILVEGSVLIKSKDDKIIRQVNPYDLLGHVQVVFDLKQRGQKAKTLKYTYCMVIRAQNFRNVWQKQDQVSKAYNYIKTNSYFDSLSQFDKKHLSLMMIKNSFVKNEILTPIGLINQKIFFIIYGQVYVLKKLSVKNSEKQVILQSLHQMDSFGQYQSVNKQVSEVSLKAGSTGTYYYINFSQVVQIKHPFVELAREKGLPYPDRQQLQFRFKIQSEVQRAKNLVKRKLNIYK